METRHSYPKHTTKTLTIAHIGFDICQGNFRGIWKTHSLMESMVVDVYESKIVVLKHFGCDVSPKESSAPFLFTIYILKSVFCTGNSVKYALIDV